MNGPVTPSSAALRLRRRRSVLAGATAACGALLLRCSESKVPPPPLASGANVLLVTLDTTRADRLGCYGGDPAVSPTIDRLAAAGVLYTQAHTAVPYTLPSHTTLMTGQPPFVHGVRTNGIYRVPSAARTLAEHFQAAGYRTAAFPSAEVLLAVQGLDQGFETYDDRLDTGSEGSVGERPAEQTTAYFLDWLRAEQRVPFFAWVHYFDPHHPYAPPADLAGRFASDYEAEIHHVDRHLQKVLAALLQLGLGDSTLVCLTADHGEGLGDHGEDSHGNFLYESTMRVPLLFSHPALSARRVTRAVSLEDVAPTLVELVGLTPFVCAGRSLVAELRGEAQDPRPLYLETYNPYLSFGWSPLESVLDQDWKYIDAPTPELYHVGADPAEEHDLHDAEPARADTLRALLQELRSAGEERLGQELVALDAESAAQLEALGYFVPGERAVKEALPPPGRGAGPDPKERRSVLPLISELFGAGKEENSRAIFSLCDRIQAVDPDNPVALQYRATELVRLGQHRQALAPLETMDRLGHSSPKSLQVLGVARLHTSDLDGAAEAFERCLSRSPRDEVTLRWYGEVEERRGRPARAIELYERLLQDFQGPDAAAEQIVQRIRVLREQQH